MLELYNFSQSTCSQKVRLCLAEKRLEWKDHRLISRNGDHLSDWYTKLNPNRVVPTLIHDGNPVYESSVIIQYLDDVFPEPRLSPGDALGKAQLRAWLAFIDHVPTPAIRYPSFQHGGLGKKFQELTTEEFEDACRKRPLKYYFYQSLGQDGFSDKHMQKAIDDVTITAERMNTALAETGGPWIMGELYSLADMAVAPLIDRMEDLGYDYLWNDQFPNVTDWLERMKARPNYAETFYEKTRLSEIFPHFQRAERPPRLDA